VEREEAPRHLPDHSVGGVKIEQDGLWCTGFRLDSIDLCHWLSGLVDVHYVEIRVIDGDPVAFFYVTSKDRSGNLFRDGLLNGRQIDSFYKDLQTKYVVFEPDSNTSTA
jgi:hypothetical protein